MKFIITYISNNCFQVETPSYLEFSWGQAFLSLTKRCKELKYESGEGLAKRSCTHIPSSSTAHAQAAPESKHSSSQSRAAAGSDAAVAMHTGREAAGMNTWCSLSQLYHSLQAQHSYHLNFGALLKHRLKAKNGQNTLRGGAGTPECHLQEDASTFPEGTAP